MDVAQTAYARHHIGDPVTAVLTTTHLQHTHLLAHVDGLGAGSRAPDLHVVVAINDVDVAKHRLPITTDRWSTVVRTLRTTAQGLPVAAARNLAAQTAIDHGAEVLVFLDADCIPDPGLLQRYAEAVSRQATKSPALWCGEVAQLGPPPAVGYPITGLETLATYPEGRPRLRPREVRPEPDVERFCAMSFAISAQDWPATGGFCEHYVGHGGEGADFAQVVRHAGGSLTWLGGATAYHQHDQRHAPTMEHVEAVVRNAGIFYDRWGWWPMQGRLEELERRGLAGLDAATGRWGMAA